MASCNSIGFSIEFIGGYFYRYELKCIKKCQDQAIADKRLALEHRQFLFDLTYDDNGYPLYQDKHVGDVYLLRKE